MSIRTAFQAIALAVGIGILAPPAFAAPEPDIRQANAGVANPNVIEIRNDRRYERRPGVVIGLPTVTLSVDNGWQTRYREQYRYPERWRARPYYAPRQSDYWRGYNDGRYGNRQGWQYNDRHRRW